MPNNITNGDPKKEHIWKRAEAAFKKSYGHEPKDGEFAIVHAIYTKILENSKD